MTSVYAVERAQGATTAQIVAKTGVARTSSYRHAPLHPPGLVTTDGAAPAAVPDVGQGSR